MSKVLKMVHLDRSAGSENWVYDRFTYCNVPRLATGAKFPISKPTSHSRVSRRNPDSEPMSVTRVNEIDSSSSV
jgi:hypothetical protein